MQSFGNMGPGDMLGLASAESYATAVRGTCGAGPSDLRPCATSCSEARIDAWRRRPGATRTVTQGPLREQHRICCCEACPMSERMFWSALAVIAMSLVIIGVLHVLNTLL